MPDWLAGRPAGWLAFELDSWQARCRDATCWLVFWLALVKTFAFRAVPPKTQTFAFRALGHQLLTFTMTVLHLFWKCCYMENFLRGPEACQTSTSWQAGKLVNRPISQSTSWPDSKHQGQQVSQPEPPGQAAKQLADCTANQSLLATFMRTSLQTNGTQSH